MARQQTHFASVKANGWGALALFGTALLIGSADWGTTQLASLCRGAEGEVVGALAGAALSTLHTAGSARHGIWYCLFHLALLLPYVVLILSGTI
jgi:hypothetical protein